MRELYSDDSASVAGDGAPRLLPEGVRRVAGAVVFVGLVAAMGVWAWRLGTRDAGEVPIVKAMAGPARVAPEDPGGLRAAHQGLEVNAVLAGQPAPAPRVEPAAARPVPEVLAAEDAPQGELVLATPAVLAERVLAEAGELPMPPADAPEDMGPLVGDPVVPAVEAPPAELEPAATAEAAGPRPMNRPRNLVVARAKVEPVAARAKPKPNPETAAPAAAREVAAARPGTRMVQLGAYDSEQLTRAAWSRLVAANPDLLSSKNLYVERSTSNARVFYRLRVAGFENTEETRVMCESLRARGIDCIPVTLQ
jgi:hypothetical protein